MATVTEPYRKDDEGNLINPPIITEYEQRFAVASAAADVDAIAVITEEYNEARNKQADAANKRLEAESREQAERSPDAGAFEGRYSER